MDAEQLQQLIDLLDSDEQITVVCRTRPGCRTATRFEVWLRCPRAVWPSKMNSLGYDNKMFVRAATTQRDAMRFAVEVQQEIVQLGGRVAPIAAY